MPPVTIHTATPEQLDNEIQRIHGALVLRAFATCEELGLMAPRFEPHAYTPIDEATGKPLPERAVYLTYLMRDVFAHARGERVVPEVAEQCQTLGELLWCPVTEGTYTIPESFWETLTGQAIRACIGGKHAIPDDAEVTLSEARKVANCSQTAIANAVNSGALRVVRRAGNRRFVRAGDVRKWAGMDAGE